MNELETHDGQLSRGWQRLVLAICCLSLFMVGIDVTIVNVALPSIRTDLQTTTNGLQWIADAYAIALASLLMFSGSLADRVGRRRIFLVGLALFTLSSVLCGIAPNVSTLVAFRVVQGVGASMLNPVALSIIANAITDPGDRARAIGLWGSVIGLSLALGPVVGGGLVGAFGWRAVFFVNVPVGAMAMVLTRLFVPESRAPRPRRFDAPGQILVIAVLAGTVFGVIEGPSYGWGSAPILGTFAATLVLLLVLVVVEARRFEPLLEVRFFRSVPFAGAAAVAVAVFFMLNGLLFLNTLYLQTVRGYGPLHAGLLTLPLALSSVVCPPIAGRIVAARGARLPLMVAGLGAMASACLLLGLEIDSSLWLLAAIYLLAGIGSGMANAPITNTAVSGMPRSQAGLAAAVASASRQVGAALGVAVVGSILPVEGGTGFSDGAFIDGVHTAALVLVGCGVAIVAVGLVSTSAWATRTARRAVGPLEGAGRGSEGDMGGSPATPATFSRGFAVRSEGRTR